MVALVVGNAATQTPQGQRQKHRRRLTLDLAMLLAVGLVLMGMAFRGYRRRANDIGSASGCAEAG